MIITLFNLPILPASWVSKCPRLYSSVGLGACRSLRNTNSARGVGVRLGRVSGVLRCSCGFYSTSRSPQPIGNSKLIVTSLGRRTTRHPESARSAACGGWQRASRPYPCPQLRAWVTTMLSLILLIITLFNLPILQASLASKCPCLY